MPANAIMPPNLLRKSTKSLLVTGRFFFLRKVDVFKVGGLFYIYVGPFHGQMNKALFQAYFKEIWPSLQEDKSLSLCVQRIG